MSKLVAILPLCLSLGLPSDLIRSVLRSKLFYAFLKCPIQVTCCVPALLIIRDRPGNILWRVEIIKLQIYIY